MHEGRPLLNANIANLFNPEDSVDINTEMHEDDQDLFADLPLDFALIGAMGTEPQTIDKAFCGPNAKAWQEALDWTMKLVSWRSSGRGY